MAEVAVSGENHRHAACVRSVDNFLVAHRAARLNRRRCAGVRRREQAVGKREERVARDNGALEREPGFARLPHGDAGRIDGKNNPFTCLRRNGTKNQALCFVPATARKDVDLTRYKEIAKDNPPSVAEGEKGGSIENLQIYPHYTSSILKSEFSSFKNFFRALIPPIPHWFETK